MMSKNTNSNQVPLVLIYCRQIMRWFQHTPSSRGIMGYAGAQAGIHSPSTKLYLLLEYNKQSNALFNMTSITFPVQI